MSVANHFFVVVKNVQVDNVLVVSFLGKELFNVGTFIKMIHVPLAINIIVSFFYEVKLNITRNEMGVEVV